MPWVNPTTPNLTDYLSFLYGTVGIPTANYPSLAGTASSGTTLTLVDTTQNWTLNQWANYALNDSTQGVTGYIASNTSNTLTLTSVLTAPINAGDAYLISLSSLETTFDVAMDLVNETLNHASPQIYVLAVYNLGADRLINFAQDIPEQSYFADLRSKYRVMDVSVGVAAAVNDQGTSVGILNPDQMRTFTLLDLQTLKTPFGRTYMGFAQQYGTNLWGLS
jgi:hypothetical protein